VRRSDDTVSREFVQWLASLAPEGETALIVRQKPREPIEYHADGAIKATWPAFLPKHGNIAGEAWYGNTASFMRERFADGRPSASAANCEYVLVMVLDDIGTKSKTPPLPPTWVMETSAGNFQWGYAFSEQPTKAEFAAAIRAVADAGFTDPGACNPVRNFRIPGSVNFKPGRGAFASRLVEWERAREYTLDEICDALGVVPGAPESAGPRSIRLADDGGDDVAAWLSEQGLVLSRPNAEGWMGVMCPQADQHTDGSPEGRYLPASRAFCCLHSHCIDLNSVTFLRWVAEQGGPSHAPGLREELLQTRLAGSLPPPPPGATEETQRLIAEVERKEAGRTEMKAWFSRFAYILPEDSYFDLQELTEVSRNGFNALFRHIRCVSIHPTAAGKPRIVEASVSYDEHRQDMNAKVLAGVTYAAGETTLCTRDGNIYANRWRNARPPVAGGGDPSLWLAHVERMIPDPAERAHVLDVMAFKVQNPRIKVNHAILHGGTAGAGKDTMWAPFFWAIGGPTRNNVALLENDRLQTQWGYHLEAEVIVINELRQSDASDRRALENRLKSIIAAPPELLVVERKGMHPYYVPNRAQVVAFTNERGAIALSTEDRRWFVTWTHAGRMERAKEFWDWLGSGGFEAVAGWLHARDVAAFDPGAAPPWTDAKEAMLSAARPLAESWLIEMIREGRGEFAPGIVGGPWGAFADRLQGQAPAGARIFPSSLIHALTDAGWADLGMCHSKNFKTKKHIFVSPDWRGNKADARDAIEARAAVSGPLALVKVG